MRDGDRNLLAMENIKPPEISEELIARLKTDTSKAFPHPVNVYNYIGKILTANEIEAVKQKLVNELKQNEEKVNQLCEKISADKWTDERLNFVAAKYFRNADTFWSIEQVCDYSVNLYPYAWFIDQCNRGRAEQIEFWQLYGIVLYKFTDKTTLPEPYNKIDTATKSQNPDVDFSRCLGYYRQEIDRNVSEETRRSIAEKVKAFGPAYVEAKIDEYVYKQHNISGVSLRKNEQYVIEITKTKKRLVVLFTGVNFKDEYSNIYPMGIFTLIGKAAPECFITVKPKKTRMIIEENEL